MHRVVEPVVAWLSLGYVCKILLMASWNRGRCHIHHLLLLIMRLQMVVQGVVVVHRVLACLLEALHHVWWSGHTQLTIASHVELLLTILCAPKLPPLEVGA